MPLLVVTPTSPTAAPTGAMLDIASLPDEYAVLVAVDPTDGGTALVVAHEGELHSLFVPEGGTLAVVSYADSNALEVASSW